MVCLRNTPEIRELLDKRSIKYHVRRKKIILENTKDLPKEIAINNDIEFMDSFFTIYDKEKLPVFTKSVVRKVCKYSTLNTILFLQDKLGNQYFKDHDIQYKILIRDDLEIVDSLLVIDKYDAMNWIGRLSRTCNDVGLRMNSFKYLVSKLDSGDYGGVICECLHNGCKEYAQYILSINERTLSECYLLRPTKKDSYCRDLFIKIMELVQDGYIIISESTKLKMYFKLIKYDNQNALDLFLKNFPIDKSVSDIAKIMYPDSIKN
jgi:hypothetical protein